MDHKKEYRQVFVCGGLLDSFEKSSNSFPKPKQTDFDNLPEEIKSDFKNYSEYKKHVEDQNEIVKSAMITKLNEAKTLYKDYTKGNDSEKIDFDNEANVLISEIEA